MRQLLQIVHVSDLHIADGALGGQLPPWAEKLARCTAELPILGPWVRHGLDPHDPAAMTAAEAFVRRITTGRDGWLGPTWLVDTGDLTTFGDDASLLRGQRYLTRLGRYCSRVLSLHGNHDAWPEDFPLASRTTIKAHRQQLRTQHYAAEWPESPEVLMPPRAPLRIELYGLNSVEHMPEWNVAALGRVVHDRFWETPAGKRVAGHALARLQGKVPPASDRTALRLVAVHHPIARVDYFPHHRVLGGLGVARRLRTPHCFHLILGGHTHAFYPRHGRLQPSLALNPQRPLGDTQLQLVVGSLLQRDFSPSDPAPLQPDRWAHQMQVLRLLYDGEHDAVVLERYLAGRNPGPDPHFDIRPLPGQAISHEEVRIQVDELS